MLSKKTFIIFTLLAQLTTNLQGMDNKADGQKDIFKKTIDVNLVKLKCHQEKLLDEKKIKFSADEDEKVKISCCSVLDINDRHEVDMVMRVQSAALSCGMREPILILFYNFNDDKSRHLNKEGWSDQDANLMVVPKPSTYRNTEKPEQGFKAVLFTAYHELGHLFLEPKQRKELKKEVVVGMAVLATSVSLGIYGVYKGLQLSCPTSYAGEWACSAISNVGGVVGGLFLTRYPLKALHVLGKRIAPSYFSGQLFKNLDIYQFSSAKQKKQIKFLVGKKKDARVVQHAAQRRREVNADHFALELLVKQKEYDAIILGLLVYLCEKLGAGKKLSCGLDHPDTDLRIALQIKKLASMGLTVEQLVAGMKHQDLGKRFMELYEPFKKSNPELFA